MGELEHVGPIAKDVVAEVRGLAELKRDAKTLAPMFDFLENVARQARCSRNRVIAELLEDAGRSVARAVDRIREL